jgi:hypothetical protein
MMPLQNPKRAPHLLSLRFAPWRGVDYGSI